ncbi:transposon TX1 uncharacterized 149 kDa protein [Nephila pilipes]|uniref:Transposon TX1 uncharacterized 149 kDa protein n=1 Tax=Nephila pilipes TaxID=299642 RepID=A0A8X6NS81_NEPPI|nr:transposon TX1 uncharacterized 149 kDa protein [Nephila pilipes]
MRVCEHSFIDELPLLISAIDPITLCLACCCFALFPPGAPVPCLFRSLKSPGHAVPAFIPSVQTSFPSWDGPGSELSEAWLWLFPWAGGPGCAQPKIIDHSQNVIVPIVEDHTDLVSPVKAFIEQLYIPDPEKVKKNPVKKGCLLPNLSKTISDNNSPDHSPPAGEVQVSVEIHKKPASQPSPPKLCNLCDFVAKKKSGLRLHFYKEHRFTIIPPPSHLADLSEAIDVLPSQEDPPPMTVDLKLPKKVSFKLSNNILVPPPTSDAASSPPDILPPPPSFSEIDPDFKTPPARRQANSTTQSSINPVKFVSFENNVLKYFFPIQKKLCCPVPNCSASFGTKLWYLTNSSLKKHLNVFHKSKPSKIEFFCTICDSKISKLPSKHNCLINNLILPPDPIDDDVWVCDLCPDFSASSAIAKRNHLASHKRQTIVEKNTPLIIPPSSSTTKKKRRRRIQDLSEGHPGDTPLACPRNNTSAPSPTEDDDNVPLQEKLDLEQPSLLNSFVEPLDALFDVDEIDNILPTFESVVSDIVSVIQDHFKLSKPTASNSSKKNKPFKPFDPQDAQRVQKLYHWNRKRCVRNLQNPVSSRCAIPKLKLSEHFSKTWSPSSLQIDFPSVTPPDLPPVVDFLSPEMVFSCLQGCENSAPGPDLISYKHWREIDPRGIILSKIFNICIKIKKIPPSWKQSSCVLIPKKGDLSITENWRPISLSSTIYKLFTKCLTRTLQEWCETHGVISNCQKGFTPFDGVVEHNFVIGQHMEMARRSHSDIFLIWLDISNAFGSIPHEVLFRALSNHGIDPDFVDIIRDIYNNSFTQILSNEGPTEPIPLLCGVKQGCPLSGLLFNLSINHILFNLQKNYASHSPASPVKNKVPSEEFVEGRKNWPRSVERRNEKEEGEPRLEEFRISTTRRRPEKKRSGPCWNTGRSGERSSRTENKTKELYVSQPTPRKTVPFSLVVQKRRRELCCNEMGV